MGVSFIKTNMIFSPSVKESQTVMHAPLVHLFLVNIERKSDQLYTQQKKFCTDGFSGKLCLGQR